MHAYHDNAPQASTSRHGFTLIELLVVISIISLLIAILLPALSKAREAGRAASCLSNQKQLGLAFSMYMGDFKEYYPPHDYAMFWSGQPEYKINVVWNWAFELKKKNYLSTAKVYRCPTAVMGFDHPTGGAQDDMVVSPDTASRYRYVNYGYNTYFIGSSYRAKPSASSAERRAPARIVDILSPTTTMVLMEAYESGASGARGRYISYDGGAAVTNDPHNKGANLLWADGHASRIAEARSELDGSLTSRAKYFDWD